MNDNKLHSSKVSEMNLIRVKFWNLLSETDNCKIAEDTIEYIIANAFPQYSPKDIFVDIKSREIKVFLNTLVSNSEVECLLWVSIVNILNNDHIRNMIPVELFNSCIQYPALLYSVTFNHNGSITIKL